MARKLTTMSEWNRPRWYDRLQMPWTHIWPRNQWTIWWRAMATTNATTQPNSNWNIFSLLSAIGSFGHQFQYIQTSGWSHGRHSQKEIENSARSAARQPLWHTAPHSRHWTRHSRYPWAKLEKAYFQGSFPSTCLFRSLVEQFVAE